MPPQTASRLGMPLLRAGFPQYDLVGGYARTWVGYRGTRQALFDLANLILGQHHEIEPYRSIYWDDTRHGARTMSSRRLALVWSTEQEPRHAQGRLCHRRPQPGQSALRRRRAASPIYAVDAEQGDAGRRGRVRRRAMDGNEDKLGAKIAALKAARRSIAWRSAARRSSKLLAKGVQPMRLEEVDAVHRHLLAEIAKAVRDGGVPWIDQAIAAQTKAKAEPLRRMADEGWAGMSANMIEHRGIVHRVDDGKAIVAIETAGCSSCGQGSSCGSGKMASGRPATMLTLPVAGDIKAGDVVLIGAGREHADPLGACSATCFRPSPCCSAPGSGQHRRLGSDGARPRSAPLPASSPRCVDRPHRHRPGAGPDAGRRN